MRTAHAIAAAVLIAASSCSSATTPRPAASLAPDAAAPLDAAVAAAPAPRTVVARAVASPADRRLDASAANDAVAPESRFRIEVSGSDFVRVRLFDGSGRMVESADRRESGESVRYELRPLAPLAPGSRYVLAVDSGPATRVAATPAADGFETRYQIRTSGDKIETPATPAAPKRKSKRRR